MVDRVGSSVGTTCIATHAGLDGWSAGMVGIPCADARSNDTEFMPRRASGSAVPVAAVEPAKEAPVAEAPAVPERSMISKAATGVALLGGAVQGVLIDRPRILLACRRAHDSGQTLKWAAELASGRATNDLVPITGGVMSLGGRTITTQGWHHANRASNAIGVGLTIVGMVYGIPNLFDGWRIGGGSAGLVETLPGRTGLMASGAAAVEASLIATSLLLTHRAGSGNLWARALAHPMHTSTAAQVGKSLVGVPVIANEFGFLDFADRGDDRSVSETAVDSARAALSNVQNLIR